MNLYLRFFKLFFESFFYSSGQDLHQIFSYTYWVNPGDIDLNLHMNNGRYLTIMDLGRFQMMLKARIFWPLLFKGYYPVVASQSIRFKKSLGLFAKFRLETQMRSVGEKDFFITQKFFLKGRLAAEALVKGRFKKRGQKGSVCLGELFADIKRQQPPLFVEDELVSTQVKIESLLAQERV